MWSVEFSQNAFDSFQDLDKATQERVRDKIGWLQDNFDAIKPEALSGDLAHLNKLRVGDWRVLYTSDKESKIIWVVGVGHRSDIYDN